MALSILCSAVRNDSQGQSLRKYLSCYNKYMSQFNASPVIKNKFETLSDDELINDYMANGNERAFGVLYNRYQDMVLDKARSFTGNDTEKAKELTQDVFEQVAKAFQDGKYTEQGKFKAWLKRTATNHFINIYRKDKKSLGKSLYLKDGIDSRIANQADEEILPDASIDEEIILQAFQDAINTLDPYLARLAVLRFIEDLSYEDIQKTLSEEFPDKATQEDKLIPLGSVKGQIYRLREVLQKKLNYLRDKNTE